MMIARRLWLVVPVAGFLVAACSKEKPGETVGRGSDETVETPVQAVVDQAVDEIVTGGAALSAEERAAKLGFVGHLSRDTELVLSIYDGKGIVKNLAGLKFWQVVQKLGEQRSGTTLEELIGPQAAVAEQFLGEEMFIAMGADTSVQAGILGDTGAKVNYYEFRMLGDAFAKAVVEGDLDQIAQRFTDGRQYVEMYRELSAFMPQVEEFQVPALLAGVKISDEEALGSAVEQLAEVFRQGEAEELSEPIEIEKGGATLSGYIFKGATFAKLIAEDHPEVDGLSEEDHEALLEALKGKDLVVASGRLGPYLLVYFGPSVEAFPVADDVSESLAANDAVSFVDAYRDKPVYGFVFGSEELMESLIGGGLKEMADGFRDGISGVDGFGQARELTTLLGMIGEKERALLELYSADTQGGIITVDEGARFELFGGINSQAVDHEAAHQLAALGEGEDVLFFGNWVAGKEYDERMAEQIDVLVETLYELANKVTTLNSSSEEMAAFQEQFKTFDGLFRKDLLALLDGVELASTGMGRERAVVIDLAAEVPSYPGIPTPLVEDGRFIRASFVAPVVDRSKLRESWAMIDGSIRSMLVSAKELGVEDLNMLKPTSSEKIGVVTWYFDGLALSDDVKPSVTVTDQWFVASTSRAQALDLVARAGSEAKSPRKGAWCSFNVDALRVYVDEMLTLVENNAEEILKSEGNRRDFAEILPEVREALESLKEFEAVTLHERKVGGRQQTTLHFKTR